MKKRLLTLLVAIGLSTGLFAFIRPATSSALSGGEFQNGNIIDDGVFFNSASMSVQQIQNFLNAKVPSCDTWGTQTYTSTQTRAQYGAAHGNPAPYTCLRDYSMSTPSVAGEPGLCNDYTGGTKTSAQLIYDVSKACGVNPEVLLTLLQKEQHLVTDDWPWPIQYRSATGYGCPDTAACDSTYYGLFNQIYQAARVYKKYARDASTYNYLSGRNNNILFNPSSSCGSSSVYVQNQATAGLYNYTPYQPNQAALNNLYGTGDSCSSYGNRNFWTQFSDWFGSTHGSLIRTVDSASLYYTDGQRRFTIPNMDLAAQYGLGLGDVRFVSQQEMDSIPLASAPFSDGLGYIVKSDSDTDADGGALYLVDNRNRIPIASMQQFTDMGFTSDMIRYLPLATIQRLSLVPNNLSSFIQGPDFSVYKIEGGKKRAIFELATLSQEDPSGVITPLSNFTINNLWNSYTNPLVTGAYVALGPNSAVRLYSGTSFYTINSMGIFNCWNMGSLRQFKVTSFDVTNGTSAGGINCTAKDSSGNAFLLDGTRRFALSSSTNVSPTYINDTLLSNIPLATLKGVLKGSGSELSVLQNNERRPIPSMNAFSQLGFTGDNIDTLSDASYSSLSVGAKDLPVGTLLLEPGGALSIIDSSTSRLQITSIRQFEDFGYSWNQLFTASAKELAAYTSHGNLQNYNMVNGNLYVIDAKVHYLIDPSLDVPLGITRTNIPSVDPKVGLNSTLPWQMTRFIKSSQSSAVYYLDNGTKRPISSWQRVVDLGGANQITILSDSFVQSLPSGATI